MSYLSLLFKNNAHPFAVAGLEGNMYGCNFGSVTTPLATAATTAITARRPSAWLRIPAGTIVIPSSVQITVEAAGITTQGEIAVAITTNDVGDGTSSAGTTQPLNLNPDSTKTSLCSTRQLATADVTLEAGYLELKRFSFAASAVNQDFRLNFGDDLPVIPLRGDATLALYIGGNAVNFFAQFLFLEMLEEFAT